MKGPLKHSSQAGVAIVLVMSAITLMAVMIIQFKFDTSLNQIKVYNQQERSQARFNAESGLYFGMALLDMYKETLNLLEKKPEQKKQVPAEVLNLIYSQPFIYPIPLTEEMALTTRSTLESFMEKTVIQGGLEVYITNAGQLMNLNMLRIYSVKNIQDEYKKKPKDQNQTPGDDPDDRPEDDPDLGDQKKNAKTVLNIEKKLVTMLNRALEFKKEKDELFAIRHANVDPEVLIKTIKFYVNPPETFATDPDMQEIEFLFSDIDLVPKHAPMTSLSELYLLPGWDDQLVDLIINEVTVHGNLTIDLNKITLNTLRLILPDYDDSQLKEFFKWRDDPENPRYINSVDDFKKWVVSEAVLLSEAEFDQIIKDFKEAGIEFGVNSNLFKIKTVGKYREAEVHLNGWVTIPVKPPPPPKRPPGQRADEGPFNENPTPPPPAPNAKKEQDPPLQFLRPRLVELYIN